MLLNGEDDKTGVCVVVDMGPRGFIWLLARFEDIRIGRCSHVVDSDLEYWHAPCRNGRETGKCSIWDECGSKTDVENREEQWDENDVLELLYSQRTLHSKTPYRFPEIPSDLSHPNSNGLSHSVCSVYIISALHHLGFPCCLAVVSLLEKSFANSSADVLERGSTLHRKSHL